MIKKFPKTIYVKWEETRNERTTARRTLEMKKLLGLGLALFLVGCGEQSAVSAIEAMGFKDVRLTGFVWWGCDPKSDSPLFNTKFTATAVNGKPVDGVACGGFLKGWTVRID